jgi:hypothetical protein
MGVAEPVVRVLAAVIERKRRHLVRLRPSAKRYGGLREFPGGKLEQGSRPRTPPGATCGRSWDRDHIGRADPLVHREISSAFHIEFVKVVVPEAPRALEHDAVQ